ncbi:MAG: hybrid sensor histidine kinase/response regulator [Thermoflexales bacterium]|nr:hybrid sensor histidine kinase/response regulator [Thermoflexales bacterium]
MQSNDILIVDDTPANLHALSAILRDEYAVRCVTSGKAVLRAAQADPPALILLDIRMPGMDGYEVCQRLKSESSTRDIPIIFISALDSTEDKVKAFEAGGVDYITKPFQEAEVLARVKTHLTLRQLQVNLERLVRQRTQELEQAYERLGQLDRSKADFINVMAHELRTPLTVVKGYAQLLGNVPVSPQSELRALVDGIANGAARMHEIVNDMLDMARIDAETLLPSSDALCLSSLGERLLTEFGPAVQERRLTLSVALNGLAVHADPDLLYKAFYHLVINAIKYTPDGGRVTVSGRAVPDEGQVEIVVADTGIGIAPEFHELIFVKFYQTGQVAFHSSGRIKFKGGGPGLGLAIVRGVVLAHGGKIWVESEGHDEQRCPGSRFYVRLPADGQAGAASRQS